MFHRIAITRLRVLATVITWSTAVFSMDGNGGDDKESDGRARLPRQGVEIVVRVDAGQDLGQYLGTLFEARDTNGHRVLGAGFVAAYNTFHRSARYKVQFYVRNPVDSTPPLVRKLPKPFASTGTYLMPLGGAVYAMDPSGASVGPSGWDEQHHIWSQEPLKMDMAYGTVRGKPLKAQNGGLYHGDKLVLQKPPKGVLEGFHYGNGTLTLFHRHAGSGEENGFNRLLALPWSAYAADPRVDLDHAIGIELRHPFETPYAQCIVPEGILITTNKGGCYLFDGREWKVLREVDLKVSFQLYGFALYEGRTLLAQYPSGNLFEYTEGTLRHLRNAPPVPPGTSPSYREAQTMNIYRGELFVGVWPWAEVWRLDPERTSWHLVRRMFTHPERDRGMNHPYESEMQRRGHVLNLLGQRVTSMVSMGTDLLVSTGSKSGQMLDAAKDGDFLEPDQFEEYGAVYSMTLPGHLSAVIQWREGPTELRFLIKDGVMTIKQDGRTLGSTPVDMDLVPAPGSYTVSYGNGVFGPFGGRSLTH